MPLDPNVKSFLRYGPYAAPPIQEGQYAHCAIRGKVRVVGLSKGRIPWPKGRCGKRGTCPGDLRRVGAGNPPGIRFGGLLLVGCDRADRQQVAESPGRRPRDGGYVSPQAAELWPALGGGDPPKGTASAPHARMAKENE